MWISKKITLLNDPQWQTGQLLTREMLAEHQQALTLLRLAEQQAREKLEDAAQQASAMLAEAESRFKREMAEQRSQQQQDFLARSGQLFSDWQSQQQAWQEGLLPHAEALLAQAINQLLTELPPAARLQAMLRQLMKAQGRAASATLLCPPQQQQEVAAWLEQHPQLAWQLTVDATLEPECLVLTTEKGELHLSWQHLCKALLPVA